MFQFMYIYIRMTSFALVLSLSCSLVLLTKSYQVLLPESDMVHFDALISNLLFILQYFDFMRPRKPAEIPHHCRFVYFWLCCSLIKQVSVYVLQLIH